MVLLLRDRCFSFIYSTGEGKKSKNKAGNNNGNSSSSSNTGNHIERPRGNDIPLYRKQMPAFFQKLVDEINPIPWCANDVSDTRDCSTRSMLQCNTGK